MGDIKRIAATVFLICAACAMLGAKRQPARKPASARDAPPPLQCLGGELEAKGHLLVITPTLKNVQWKDYFRVISDLGSQDPVRVAQVLGYFMDSSQTRILDFSLDQEEARDAFKSLARFGAGGDFKGPVPIQLSGELQKDEKGPDRELKVIVDAMNGKDLRKFKDRMTGHWIAKSDRGDKIAAFRMETEKSTLIGAVEFHDGTDECLSLDLKSKRRILPVGISKAAIPSQYPFELPVEPPVKVTYFYGPRIFNSSNASMVLEGHQGGPPISLKIREKGPMEFLNKYWQVHSGIDFAVGKGTPVYAPYDGVVFALGPMGCAGNTMVISHTLPEAGGKPIFSVYEHLAGASGKVVVNPDGSIRAYRKGEHLKRGQKLRPLTVGDPVLQGELIARSGASGRKIGFSHGFKEGCVDGAHLHFELRVPNDLSAGLKREIATAIRNHKSINMGSRFRFVERETIPVNPADYIYDVDVSCQSRKNVEIRNAVALKDFDPRRIPPISAGTCGYKYESSLKSLPNIYHLSRKKTDLINDEPHVARGPAGRR